MSNEAHPLTHNEEIKTAIPTVAGTIAATLADTEADHFSQDDYEFLKFHGCYQQDDRDLRKTQKKYIMMVRSRIPGGVMTANQWKIFDRLASEYGNNTLRVTTRQTIQFHGILKNNLRAVIKGINESLLSTLAACGDVSRNVLAPPTPAYTKARDEVYADCKAIALALAPRTKAYHSIWIEGVQLDLDSEENKNFVDPLFGRSYLPRKFKVAFAIPPVNDVDVFTNDVGFIAVVENDQVTGYNVAVGGGMGRSHGNEQTYPRLADVIGFLPREKMAEVTKAALTIHRDFGDRTNRKHARFKYIVAERGVDWTRAEIEQRAGLKLSPAREYKFTTTADLLDWRQATDGKWFLTVFVETGRVKDVEGRKLKTALREAAEQFPNLEFRLTTNQNVILANADHREKGAITALLAARGVKTENQAGVLRAAAMACPALPTCGLALAESERLLPGLIDRIEKLCAEVGLAGEEIIIRSTGCPNGCARPYMAEIAFVGKSPGRYQLWLGGNVPGTRLNRVWKDVVKDPEIEGELRPVLTRFVKERHPGERFGDFCARVLWKEQEVAVAN
ncbi:MAG TPA: NADPH-dependent assimilatory sulfite reductase hemoprotein subunit [Verrucomicrobiae bacterium]|nr:NADPH-dependent assimilatory sulfite reductase hemoprotein subunit [Verrucomicrobiae bacterium]